MPIAFKVKTDQDLKIIFPKSAKEIKTISESACQSAKLSMEKLCAISKDDVTFENFAKQHDEIYRAFFTDLWRIHLLGNVHPDADVVDAARKHEVELRTFASENLYNAEVYERFKVVKEKEGDQVGEEEQYFLNRMMFDLEFAGCGLSGEKLTRFQDLEGRLKTLESEFAKNIADEDGKIVCTEKDLNGVSQRMLESWEKDDQGNYLLGTDYPTVGEVMSYCKVGETRKRLSELSNNRAWPANDKVLKEIMEVRHEVAQLLGYEDFSDMFVQDKMTGGKKNVEKFLHEITNAVKSKAAQEVKKLTSDLPEGVSLNEQGLMNGWDVGYSMNSYRKKHLDLDCREVQEYFPAEFTINGLFEIYQNLLDLKFEITKNPDGAWHEDVTLITVKDKQGRAVLGYIYLDLYPRPGKYTHACCVELVVPSIEDNYPGVTCVIANFPKSTEDAPALMKHDDVNTFFHEFGHAMHFVMGRTKMAKFGGFFAPQDFVETHSQMFEEWVWEPHVLKKISSHYKTGESLPDHLIEKLIKSRRIFSGYGYLSQIMLSWFSLRAFGLPLPTNFKTLEKEIYDRTPVHLTSFNNNSHRYASFGHIASFEYASGYYFYLWSKVFAKDLYAEVKSKGLDSQEAKELVQKLLSAGGGIDPNELLKRLLGREPSFDAFRNAIED